MGFRSITKGNDTEMNQTNGCNHITSTKSQVSVQVAVSARNESALTEADFGDGALPAVPHGLDFTQISQSCHTERARTIGFLAKWWC